MTTIASNLQAVRNAIEAAAIDSGRNPGEVSLLAVSKTFSSDAISEAYQANQTMFAESYVQEALSKMSILKGLQIDWHFIGPIQSNKTRSIAENFSWAHSVDRLKVAERLSEQRPVHMPPLQVCLQVNISKEESKKGIAEDEAEELAQVIAKLPNITLRGLMTIPATSDDISEQRKPFARLRELRDRLNRKGLKLDTLSMGMSHDFAAAIAEGATMVRIGTAIFGNRSYQDK